MPTGIGVAILGGLGVTGASAAVAGIVGGAVAGAVIGGVTSAIKGGNILKGALVGGALGGIGGGIYGAVTAPAAGVGAEFMAPVMATEAAGGLAGTEFAGMEAAQQLARGGISTGIGDTLAAGAAKTATGGGLFGGDIGKMMLMQGGLQGISGMASGVMQGQAVEDQAEASRRSRVATPIDYRMPAVTFTDADTQARSNTMFQPALAVPGVANATAPNPIQPNTAATTPIARP